MQYAFVGSAVAGEKAQSKLPAKNFEQLENTAAFLP